MGWAVSGATTLVASTGRSYQSDTKGADGGIQASYTLPVTGLTAGSNTFTAKYAIETAGTGSFSVRHISVVGLP